MFYKEYFQNKSTLVSNTENHKVQFNHDYNSNFNKGKDDYNDYDIIDLQSRSNKSSNNLPMETMSAVIATAVQMSLAHATPSIQSRSSLKNKLTVKKRLTLFSHNFKKPFLYERIEPNKINLNPNSTLNTTYQENNSKPKHSKVDYGLDELIYRGIQIKEIKTTLDTLIIKDPFYLPTSIDKINSTTPKDKIDFSILKNQIISNLNYKLHL